LPNQTIEAGAVEMHCLQQFPARVPELVVAALAGGRQALPFAQQLDSLIFEPARFLVDVGDRVEGRK
jgi:hypothetical protein